MNILRDKKLVLIIILFILVAVVYELMDLKFMRSSLVEENTNIPKVTYVPQEELPKELPTDLPLEAKVPLLRNEILEARDGSEVQHVRMYYSAKTVKENYDIYKKYLLDNGWKIGLESVEDNFANLIGQKEGGAGTLSVNISKNSITSDVTVEINMVLRNATP